MECGELDTVVAAFVDMQGRLVGKRTTGRFFLEAQPYALILAPKQEGELPVTVWHKKTGLVEGALSDFDGLANTRAMAEDGSPLAVKILSLAIAGRNDWYLPSRGELLLCWAAREALPKGEAFDEDWYWSSTQHAEVSRYAWSQSFLNGSQGDWHQDDKLMARAVRRVAI